MGDEEDRERGRAEDQRRRDDELNRIRLENERRAREAADEETRRREERNR